MKTINILVADHSEDTRKELTDFFEKRKDMQLVDSTDNGQDACRAIRSLQPDIVLLDVVLQAIGIRLEGTTMGDSSINLLEFGILLAAQLITLLMMNRKGLMDDNAYAEADRYPWKHYLLQGVLAGAGAAAVVCVIQFFSGAAWASMSVPYILLVFAAQLMFMVPITTVLVMLLTYVSFRYAAKRRRDTMEEQTGDD